MTVSPHHGLGFSLVEMAIVLVLVGLLLGGLMMPLTKTVEQIRRADAQRQLNEITEALLGFAASWDRLPCPASDTSAGAESSLGGGACPVQHGFVPAVTLGITGAVNEDNLLIDPWGNPYRYAVSSAGGSWAFTTANGLTLSSAGDFVVCTRDSSSVTGCGPNSGPNASIAVAMNVPAVVLSMGKNWAETPSPDEAENAGEATLGRYPMGANRIFVSQPMREATGSAYDDVTAWISIHVLFSKLVAANRLP